MCNVLYVCNSCVNPDNCARRDNRAEQRREVDNDVHIDSPGYSRRRSCLLWTSSSDLTWINLFYSVIYMYVFGDNALYYVKIIIIN